MCFTIHSNFKKLKVAKKDIQCLKFLQVDPRKRTTRAPYYTSTIYFKEDSKKKRIIKNEEFSWVGERFIERGLHSYTIDIDQNVKRSSSISLRKSTVFNAIIPKGAKYYYNPDNKEYVSTRLIVYRVE